MKFQDSTFNGLKITVGTKTFAAPTHAYSKTNMPHQLFQSWGYKKIRGMTDFSDQFRKMKCVTNVLAIIKM